MLTRDAVLAQLQQGNLTESESLELKESWKQNHGKTLSAMGNAQGGFMCIGVSDKGQLICHDKNVLIDFQHAAENHINQYLQPSCAVQSIRQEKINNHFVLIIEVINPRAVTLWNNKCYRRTGSSTTEMQPAQRRQLELKWPDLDFSSFKYEGPIDGSLVLDFAKHLSGGNGDWLGLSAAQVLSKLNLTQTNAAGILFGDFTYRLVHYDSTGDLKDQREYQGLHRVLQDDFVKNIQSWSRTQAAQLKNGSMSLQEELPYSEDALREALVNAVAHTAFEQNQRGDIKVELYVDRIEISNSCCQEAKAFIYKRFSRESFIYNPLLMKTLRSAHFVEELGTGKNKIFRYSIENGKQEPLFEYQNWSDGYGRWKVILYNKKLKPQILQTLEKLKKQYPEQSDKYKIAAAIVLWQGKSLNDILHHLNQHYKQVLLSILDDEQSPFWLRYSGLNVYIYVRPWGRDQFSADNNTSLKDVLRNYAHKDHRDGQITNQQARCILDIGHGRSSQVQVARLFQKLEAEGFIARKSTGVWKINQPFSDEYLSLMEYVKSLDSFKTF